MSHSSDTLNSHYGIPGQLQFRDDPGGLVFAEIDNALGSATVCLQGAHVTTWRPKDQAEPVVWVSPAAKYARSWLEYRLANYEQAQAMLERSLEILRPLNEPHVLVESITYLGMLMEVTGN